MKPTLLLAAIVAFSAANAVSAGESLKSPRDKASRPQFVRAEARVLGGRADRARIVASPRHAEQASLRKAKTVSERTPAAERGKSLGGRNNPR